MPISRLAIFLLLCWRLLLFVVLDDELFDSFDGDFDLFLVLLESSWDTIDDWCASFSVAVVVDDDFVAPALVDKLFVLS